ncbi:unnamed protein product [Symbiodinium sp. CCMP2592]|nr:unnamed protein product [Symbiodinium sp. CCMP2592]
MDSSLAYKRALQEMTVYDFTQVDVPLISRQDDAMGCLQDLPLKDMEGRYLAKMVIDLVPDMVWESVNFQQLEECMMQKHYNELPPPFGPKVLISMPYKLQIAIVKTSLTHCTVIKYYSFDQKVNIRLVEDMAYGTLKLLDFTPNFRAGPLAIQLMLKQMSHWFAHYIQVVPKPAKESKPKQNTDDLQSGFAYIKANGPRSNIGNQQIEWAVIETRRTDSPLHGWSAGLVKECLRGHASGIVYAKTMNDFYLTLHDLAAWFLDDVVVELLGDLKSKTIVFLGLAEKGKTPAAQAIAMAVSEYYILRDNKDDGIQPGFRICSSLDQLRGESGEKYRPDILDDPDINMVPIPKLKSFLDSSLAECHTVERWTAARFVQNQLRILCDNKINENAEPPESSGLTTDFDIFYDMIKPAFHDKANLQDIMACLKRAHFVVNMNHAIFIRKAGTTKDPVMRVPYVDGMRDFLSEDGKSVIRYMQDGNKCPPTNWVQKRQWSHDLMTLIIETQKKPPRTKTIISSATFAGGSRTRKEIKPSLPFSGRVCPAFIAQDQAHSSENMVKPISSEAPGTSSDSKSLQSEVPSSKASVAPTEIKEELDDDKNRFHMMLSNPDFNTVIDLDPTPTSPPPAKRPRSTTTDEVDHDDNEMDVADDDILPRVGMNPED